MSLIRLRMPEGGAEHEEVWVRDHGCEAARVMKRELGEAAAECDFLLFPVGLAGWEIPQGIPFTCTAIEECGACGRLLTAHFCWDSAKHLIL